MERSNNQVDKAVTSILLKACCNSSSHLSAPAVPEKLDVLSEMEDKRGLGDPRKGKSGDYLEKQRRENPGLHTAHPYSRKQTRFLSD